MGTNLRPLPPPLKTPINDPLIRVGTAWSNFFDRIFKYSSYIESVIQYGGIHFEGSSVDTVLAAQDTLYQITGFNTNGVSGGQCTPDHTENHITIGSKGVYWVHYGASVRSAAANDFDFEIRYNNGSVALAPLHAHRKTSSANALGVIANGYVAEIPEGATLEMWVLRTDGGAVSKTLTLEHVNMSVFMITKTN